MSSELPTKSLIITSSRRLRILQEQQAYHGIDTPPNVLIEIEDLKIIIAALENHLADLAKRVTNVPPFIKEDKSLNIMVTGGRKPTSEIQIELAYLIGQQVILRNHILITNGAKGVDKASSEGAIMICHSKNLKPSEKIQVFRPFNAPKPHFDFDYEKVIKIGKNYDERRNFVVHQSDVIILLGGDTGTREVVRYAQIAHRPFIPIGIGLQEETAVKLWYKMYKMHEKYLDDLPIIRIDDEDLQKIGPEQQDLNQVALSSIFIAENLTLRHTEER